jgi:predicted nicotinamide N-methyase
MESGDRTVLSEVHWDVTRSSKDGGITRFAVKRAREETAVVREVVEDKDGDLEPPRKKCKNLPSEVYTVNHKLHTPLEDVGFQVWSGCLLLVDYLLHNEVSLRGKVILELGCGCGLAGMVARRYFRS